VIEDRLPHGGLFGLPEDTWVHPDRLAARAHDQRVPTAGLPLRPTTRRRPSATPRRPRPHPRASALPPTRPPPAAAGPPTPTATDAARPPPDRSRPTNDPEPKPFRINTAIRHPRGLTGSQLR
jgi:hypothetical protein